MGAIGRSVLDVASFDDTIVDRDGNPGGTRAPMPSLAEAASREPGRLRIAVSTRPPIPGVKLSATVRAAIDETSELLSALGHTVEEHELAHPQLLTTFTPRWAAGIRAEAAALDWDSELEPRTRRMIATGRRLGGRALRRSLKRETAVAARLNAVFERHDLVITPMTAAPAPSAEISSGAGALRTFNDGSRYVCYAPTWNFVGQPAASVPAGFDDDGLPRAVQIAGPPGAEPAIVALAAQLEAARPWRDRRPSL